MITKRILIADDDPLVRNILRFFLESKSRFKVCGEAVNGLDVIEKARALSPDLVVMDVSMPVMNGIEAGSVLRVMLPQVAVVLYTSQDRATIETHARVGDWCASGHSEKRHCTLRRTPWRVSELRRIANGPPKPRLLLRHDTYLANYMTPFIQSRKLISAKVIIQSP
jgi:CheY-like chemotaxis protein